MREKQKCEKEKSEEKAKDRGENERTMENGRG